MDDPHAKIAGRKALEFLPQAWVEERLQILQRVLETGQAAMVREIWRGRQFIATVRPISHESGQQPLVLVVTQPVSGTDVGAQTKGLPLYESAFVELGALSLLTSSELVVLALIGHGLTLKEMAATLHRSVKTVDNHRTSIGRKPRNADRLTLARIAQQAGLRVGDAKLSRVKFDPRGCPDVLYRPA